MDRNGQRLDPQVAEKIAALVGFNTGATLPSTAAVEIGRGKWPLGLGGLGELQLNIEEGTAKRVSELVTVALSHRHCATWCRPTARNTHTHTRAHHFRECTTPHGHAVAASASAMSTRRGPGP